MNTKLNMGIGAAVLASVLIISFYGLGQSLASGGYDSDDDDPGHEYEEKYSDNKQFGPKMNAVYLEECGSCHMAYPAKLLPQKSWQKIMLGLEDHFGENAELDDETRNEIEEYLLHGSGQVSYQKLFRNLGDETPLRITGLPYFVHEHDEIPARMITGNDKVMSLSQCNACHRTAERGRFDEDDVVIPGFGRWDD